jgi:rhamnulokinase
LRPIEATAIGNILVQAISAGQIADISEARDIVRNSFNVKEFFPTVTDVWEAAYQRYLHYKKGSGRPNS